MGWWATLRKSVADRISYSVSRGYLGGYWIEGTRQVGERACRRCWWVSRLPIRGKWMDGVLHLDHVNSDRDLPADWPERPLWHVLAQTDFNETRTREYAAQSPDEARMGALFSEEW